jgi:hypothetical protein
MQPAEGEGGDDEEKGCGCKGCNKDEEPTEKIKRMLGDWLLIGLSLIALLGLATLQKRA